MREERVHKRVTLIDRIINAVATMVSELVDDGDKMARIAAQFPGAPPAMIAEAFDRDAERQNQAKPASQQAVREANERAQFEESQAAIYWTWAEAELAKGRPRAEINFPNCIRELGVLIEGPNGQQRYDLSRLADFAERLAAYERHIGRPSLVLPMLSKQGGRWQPDQIRCPEIA